MKAICLLLCLAIARESSGSIFRPEAGHYRPRVYFDDQSVEQNFQKQNRHQVPEYQNGPRRQYQSQEQLTRYSDSSSAQQQGSNSQEHSGSRENTKTAPGLHHLRRQQQLSISEKKQLGENLIKYADPDSRQQARQWSGESHSEQRESAESLPKGLFRFRKQSNSQGRSHDVDIIRYADLSKNSDESRSGENSHERSQVHFKLTKEFSAPAYGDDTSSFRMKTVRVGDQKLNGDVVEWRGLKMAADREQLIRKKDIAKVYIEAQKAQRHIPEDEKEQFHKDLNEAYAANDEDTHLNATQLLKKYQYPVEEHIVKTEDGYMLPVLHILPQKRAREVTPRPVVFLMHGLLGSADDYLLMGPGKSLAYLLSNDGYDVWLGNARSSKYAHHVSKHRARSDYWQFSNDEIALLDLPAMIDYVLESSNQQNMFYVGHSLGSTAFFALAATYPAYNDKIIKMFALSPMAYMGHTRSPMLRAMAPSSRVNDRIHKQLGDGEFKPSTEVINTMGGAMCDIEIGCEHVCSNAYAVLSGFNVRNVNVKRIPTILSHLPAGASKKQMEQFSEGIDSHEFRMYNFGSETNQKVYGSSEPPKYDMYHVSAPVALYYSEHDFLSHPKDVKKLKKELPNVVEYYKVPESYFGQMDFQFSKTAPKLVYQRLLESIQNSKSY